MVVPDTAELHINLLSPFVVWAASHILHLSQPITIFTNGSGDTTYNYALIFCYFSLAVVGTTVWSILDWRRLHYRYLYEWLRLFVRLVLAMAMIGYGMVKVFPIQFPPLSLDQLILPYGDSSPMGVLWKFMQASRGYTFFAGLLEVIAGLLLFVPRLTTIGSMMALAIMGNVFLLNMCYDVPVKILSFHLLLLSIFLLAPDLKRLANLLILNRTVQKAPSYPLLHRSWLNRTLLAFQLTLGALFVTWLSYRDYTISSAICEKPPLYGVWKVDTFLASSIIPSNEWNQVIIDTPSTFSVRKMNGALHSFDLQQDENTLKIIASDSKNTNAQFTYREEAPGQIVLEGQFEDQMITVHLHRLDFLLLNRGFYFINESPLFY